MKRYVLLKTMAVAFAAMAVLSAPARARDSGERHGDHAVQHQSGSGPAAKGQGGAAHDVTLFNRGDRPLAEIHIGFSGKDSADFSEKDNCGNRLAVGESCTIRLSFTPKTTGAKSASLEVSSNGGNQSVALSGTGI